MKTSTNALGQVSEFTYDLAGRMNTQILPDQREIGFSYDGEGNLTGVTPPGRPTHSFEFNSIGLLAKYIAPDVGETSSTTIYSYNLDRQLTLVARPDGKFISYTYDPVKERLNQIDTPRGSYTHSYDTNTGKISQIISPDGINLSFQYDGFLTTSTSWSGMLTGTISITYNDAFLPTSRSINGSHLIAFSYDNDDLLVQAGSLSIQRNSSHGLVDSTFLGPISDSFQYNTFGELISYSSPDYSYDFLSRDALGRVTIINETINGVSQTLQYDYDEAGRLKRTYRNGSLESEYVYDENSNRLSHIKAGVTISGSYDAQDRLLSYGRFTYNYNQNGDLTGRTDTSDSSVTAYSYDVFGNLNSVTLPDGTHIEYLVDGQNRRVAKKLNGTIVQGFLYKDQLNPIAELNGSGAIVRRFVYGTKPNVPDYMTKAGNTYRIISDHLGSVRLVVNTADGTIAQRIDYDEWGNVLSDSNPGFQPFYFAGGIYDQHTGLLRFGARDYEPYVGRWLSTDPSSFFGGISNLYIYAFNNPIYYYDSDGKRPKCAGELCNSDEGKPLDEIIRDNVRERIEKEKAFCKKYPSDPTCTQAPPTRRPRKPTDGGGKRGEGPTCNSAG